MSIKKYDKDHLKKHAGVALAAMVRIEAPESDDPLVFWTQHEKYPCEVNLHPFAIGHEEASRTQGGGRKSYPFAARPELIRQLAPAITEILLYAAKATVDGYLNALRDWWRVADAVEASAANAGQPMTRVEDVRLMTNVHCDFAHRSGMTRQIFGKFRTLVDMTRAALGVRQTYWESPEETKIQKHIPPEEHRRVLRFAIKRVCRSVLERWAQYDQFSQIATEPDDPQEAYLYRHLLHMRNVQKKTGIALPTFDELCDGFDRTTLAKRGISMRLLRESVFPSHRDADAVWHLCLLNTGWNPSTLTSLDITKRFLFDHFKDDPNDSHRRFVLSPQTYELTGEKERAGGKEQVVIGQWKTQDGPGHLIKTFLNRVAPLRELLKKQHAKEKLRYEEMHLDKTGYEARTTQFARVKALEMGLRSVWLYVNRSGNIDWISTELQKSGFVNGKQVYFMHEVVHLLNIDRAAVNAQLAISNGVQHTPLASIPNVSPSEFRVWFADFVYRTSNGSILQVKKALNHSLLRTTSGYVDTNIRNQEASDAARGFLNILVAELDVGRVDLTILAHLYRHGELSSEQVELLNHARALPKSRMNVACKDALHPPSHIKATPDKACDEQRCLLCLENAVLLPESLDGIAMRVEELRAMQGFLPIGTWAEDRYDIELKNNLTALRKFDLNKVLASRKKWAHLIACGEHYVPGLPLTSSLDLMELV
jgi:hypothetical protein